MKSCPYCGNENPDDATVCVIDGQPPVPEQPTIAPTDAVVRMTARPFTVKFAVGLLAFGWILDLALVIFQYQLHGARSRHFYSFTAYIFGIVAVFLYLVFRGKNWARWVVVCSMILGIFAGPFVRIGPPHWSTYFFTFIDIVAVVALFLRSSNEWYKGTKTVSPPVLS